MMSKNAALAFKVLLWLKYTYSFRNIHNLIPISDEAVAQYNGNHCGQIIFLYITRINRPYLIHIIQS